MMLMRLFQCELRWCDGWIHKSKMESEEDQESTFIRCNLTLQVHLTAQSARRIYHASMNVMKTEREGRRSAYLISLRERARPFDVNLKPRHKHVSRVDGGGKADRGREGGWRV